MADNKKLLSTVKPFGDPCAGDLITPVNSNIAIKTIVNSLPIYRKGLSIKSRGIQLGAAFGFVLYGPFTILGPMRNSEYSEIIGLFSTVGGITILATLFYLYGQAGGSFYKPPSNPTVSDLPEDLFSHGSWSEFQNYFWLGGLLGSVVAWFTYTNELVSQLSRISFGT